MERPESARCHRTHRFDEEIIDEIDSAIFYNEKKVLGIVASVGGFRLIPNAHGHVAWVDVELVGTIDHATVTVADLAFPE
ncbi:MAG: hypothetical protein R6V26_07025 [Roseovarius sp.]